MGNLKLYELSYEDSSDTLITNELPLKSEPERIGSFSISVESDQLNEMIIFSNKNFSLEDKGYIFTSNGEQDSIYLLANKDNGIPTKEGKDFLDEHIRYVKFKNELRELLEEDELMAHGEDNELIYQIEDIKVYGGFEEGIRGVDHNILKTDYVEWEEIFKWGTVFVPETNTYISDSVIEEFEDLGFNRQPLTENQKYNENEHDLKTNSTLDIELSVEENHYKKVCEFLSSHYQNIEINNDSLLFVPDTDNNDTFQSYNTYSELYENEFSNELLEALDYLYLEDLENELGKDTISFISANDSAFKKKYSEVSKEKDLDNDGTPDRIDYDDTRESIQTVADSDKVKNKGTKEQAREPEL